MKKTFAFILVFVCVALLFMSCRAFVDNKEETTKAETSIQTNEDATTTDGAGVTVTTETTSSTTTPTSTTTKSPADTDWTKPY